MTLVSSGLQDLQDESEARLKDKRKALTKLHKVKPDRQTLQVLCGQLVAGQGSLRQLKGYRRPDRSKRK